MVNITISYLGIGGGHGNQEQSKNQNNTTAKHLVYPSQLTKQTETIYQPLLMSCRMWYELISRYQLCQPELVNILETTSDLT